MKTRKPLKKHTCPTCGETFVKRCTPDSYIDGNCFTCSFWMEKIQRYEEGVDNVVIVNGHHYTANPYCHSGGILGHGGAEFIIHKFGGGAPIITNDLWSQGKIPEQFRDRLKDNAHFCRECYQPLPVAKVVNKDDIPF